MIRPMTDDMVTVPSAEHERLLVIEREAARVTRPLYLGTLRRLRKALAAQGGDPGPGRAQADEPLDRVAALLEQILAEVRATNVPSSRPPQGLTAVAPRRAG